MDYFFALIVYILYKLLALVPLVLILIAIIKLHNKYKNKGTYLMLAGNLGLVSKVILLDSLVDYLTRFSDTLSIVNISVAFNILSIIAVLFTTLFAIGFLIFVISLLKS